MGTCPLQGIIDKLQDVKLKNELQGLVNKAQAPAATRKYEFQTLLGIDDVGEAKEAYREQSENTERPVFDGLPVNSATPTMTYAGIGSRETPADVLELMTKAAKWLEAKGYTLRSGGAVGADTAFEVGVTNKNKKQIFKGFDKVGPKEVAIAHEVHPDLKGAMERSKNKKKEERLRAGASEAEAEKSGERSAWAVQNLMARNTNQVFGAKLDTPSDFVLFYAKETKNPRRPAGGTGQAVEMARLKGIPTINMADSDWRKQLENVVKENKEKQVNQIIPPAKNEEPTLVNKDLSENTVNKQAESKLNNGTISANELQPATVAALVKCKGQ